MEEKPPPYNPRERRQAPSAPPISHVSTDAMYSSQPLAHVYPGVYNEMPMVASGAATFSGMNAVGQYIPNSNPAFPFGSIVQSFPKQQQLNPLTPLRCQEGTVKILKGTPTDESSQPSIEHYLEVVDGVIRMTVTEENHAMKGQVVVDTSLKDFYIYMANKKSITLENNADCYTIISNNENRINRWLITLSQYCFIAPTMEGKAQKLQRGKKDFKERFLRLSSDGILTWFRSEEMDKRGAIQVRGVKCELDKTNSNIVNVLVQPKIYQFCFDSDRKALLWLAAFQWHYGRKQLKKCKAGIRNLAK